MIPTYAGFRNSPDSNDFTVNAIAGSAPNESRIFYAQFANRAGRSQKVEIGNLASDGVSIVIADGVILSTEEVFWIVISIDNLDTPVQSGILYQWQARQNDQINNQALPFAISLVTEASLSPRIIVDETYLLPSDVNPGAIAYVTATNRFYRFDPLIVDLGTHFTSYGSSQAEVVQFNWIPWDGTISADVLEVGGAGSCDRPIYNIPNPLKIPPKNGNLPSTPVKYWLNNGYTQDGLSPIENGRYTFEVKVNGVAGYENVFSDRIVYKLNGYINRETLEFAPTPVPDVVKRWNPSTGLIELPEPLPRGYAAEYEVILDFDNDDLIGKLPSKEIDIQVDIVPVSRLKSTVSELGKAIGDLIFAERDRFLIVPGTTRLSGVASFSEGYIAEDKDSQQYSGLIADTVDQKVIISGALNGFCKAEQLGYVLKHAERIRAIVSTATGEGVRAVSSAVTLSNNKLQVVVNHPRVPGTLRGTVRSDYPDLAIAGNDKGFFTPIKFRLYLQVGGQFYRKDTLDAIASDNTTVAINDLTGFTLITALPTVDPDFGLFKPSSVTTASNGSGGLTGAVTVYATYVYESPNYKVTRISQDVNPDGMVIASKSLAQAINDGLLRTNNLSDLQDLAIARNNLGVYSKVQVDSHTSNTNNPHQVTAAQIGSIDQQVLTDAIADLNLGTASTKDFGNNIGELIELVSNGGVAALPAVDGSLLTGINATGGSSGVTFEYVSGTFAAAVSATNITHYLIDTSSAIATANLPASPPDKGVVIFSDRNRTFDTNSVTLVPEVGHTINGAANYLLDQENEGVTLIFDLANNNYILSEAAVVASTNSGDMLKSVYDSNNNGVVDAAEVAITIQGNPGNNKYYGTDATGVQVFKDLAGSEIKTALEALSGPNRLFGSAIANFRQIANSPLDKFSLVYDLATNQVNWAYVNTGVGAGAILIPISQSLFAAANGLLSAYTPDLGAPTFTDVKILTTAATPSNQITAQQVQIGVVNTGAVLDLNTFNVVLRANLIYTTSSTDCLIIRYSSDGNMILVELSGSAIAVKTVIADAIATIATAAYTLTNNVSYKVEVYAIGVAIKVLVNDTVVIAEALTNSFLSATKFGIGRIN